VDQEVYPSLPIMVVDDEAQVLKSIEMALRSRGLRNIMAVKDSREVIPFLSRQEVGVVMLDLTMPFISGEELLDEIVQSFPEIPVIIITGNDEIDIAVKCMRSKAFDYMVKPVEKSRLISGVMRAVELRELKKQNEMLKSHLLTGVLEKPEAFSKIITKDAKMIGLFRYMESIAGSREPVLITGETGVGKELMARAVHTVSQCNGPFVPINVAGIDDNAFSDTLFGHVKGAFTGADSTRKGLVEKASGGSLFMDEIGDLSPASQVKLLRLLQEREYFALGLDVPKVSNARVIATTNQDLAGLQKSGRFRKDLYYRLSAHHFHIPPLRERPGDLPMLLDHFLKEASKALKKTRPSYPEELITLLSNYQFSGNIRELRAMVYDAVSRHTSGILSMEGFRAHMEQTRSCQHHESEPGTMGQGTSDLSGFRPLPTFEQATQLLVREAMKRARNNQSMAARFLGISRQRLARHLKNTPSPASSLPQEKRV